MTMTVTGAEETPAGSVSRCDQVISGNFMGSPVGEGGTQVARGGTADIKPRADAAWLCRNGASAGVSLDQPLCVNALQ